jgi:hypothetical protein
MDICEPPGRRSACVAQRRVTSSTCPTTSWVRGAEAPEGRKAATFVALAAYSGARCGALGVGGNIDLTTTDLCGNGYDLIAAGGCGASNLGMSRLAPHPTDLSPSNLLGPPPWTQLGLSVSAASKDISASHGLCASCGGLSNGSTGLGAHERQQRQRNPSDGGGGAGGGATALDRGGLGSNGGHLYARILGRGLVQEGSLGGDTGDLSRGRPGGDMGGIGVLTGNGRGASGGAVGHGLDSGTLIPHDLSASMIGGETSLWASLEER